MVKTQIEEITVGIPACNEEKDIEHVIFSILRQKGGFKLVRIIVATDGCSDQTEQIVNKISQKYKIVTLVSHIERRGKMAAINEILSLSKTRLVIIANADNQPSKNAISELLNKMTKGVGLVGPQAICQLPKNANLTEKMNQLIWQWHHLISLKNPKIVAFMLLDKTALSSIASNCPIDEPLVEATVLEKGLRVVYAPRAKLNIKPPSLLSEHISRRRSIHFGYFKMRKIHPNYSPPTMDISTLMKLIAGQITKQPFIVISAVLSEMLSRSLGYFDYIRGKKDSGLWVQSKSSKGVQQC